MATQQSLLKEYEHQLNQENEENMVSFEPPLTMGAGWRAGATQRNSTGP